jgi:chaperone required for assembly of F1-ATPase
MSKPPLTISDSYAKPLPKRFYKVVQVASLADQYTVELDGRAVKTPLKRPMAMASPVLAAAVAAEWSAQVEVINPNTMPLTRLVTTAVDAVAGQEAVVIADMASYAGSDLVCYRADTPAELIARQAVSWDPIVAFARQEFGIAFKTTTGLTHVAQPPETVSRVAEAIGALPALHVAALHQLTTLTGSVLLALALQRGRLTIDALWAAAHIDEDWQIEKWGTDEEAEVRRAHRLKDARAAAFILSTA